MSIFRRKKEDSGTITIKRVIALLNNLDEKVQLHNQVIYDRNSQGLYQSDLADYKELIKKWENILKMSFLVGDREPDKDIITIMSTYKNQKLQSNPKNSKVASQNLILLDSYLRSVLDELKKLENNYIQNINK